MLGRILALVLVGLALCCGLGKGSVQAAGEVKDIKAVVLWHAPVDDEGVPADMKVDGSGNKLRPDVMRLCLLANGEPYAGGGGVSLTFGKSVITSTGHASGTMCRSMTRLASPSPTASNS